VYAASEGLSTLTVDSISAGGQAGTTSRIENYLGFPTGLSGTELTQRAIVQAEKFGALLTAPCDVESVESSDGYLTLRLSDGTEVVGRAIVAATGARYRRLSAADLEEFEGAGVYYAATHLEARQCAGEPVVIVGGGNSAGQAAVFLADLGSSVTVVIRGSSLGASMSRYLVDRISGHPKVEVKTNSEVTALCGHSSLSAVQIRSATSSHVYPCAALFSFIGADPASRWLGSSVRLDDDGFVLTDRGLSHPFVRRSPLPYESSQAGLFAVGDLRAGSVKRVASAVGEGSGCISSVHAYLSLEV
jgi:thioredoxin reductase (NADPH)